MSHSAHCADQCRQVRVEEYLCSQNQTQKWYQDSGVLEQPNVVCLDILQPSRNAFCLQGLKIKKRMILRSERVSQLFSQLPEFGMVLRLTRFPRSLECSILLPYMTSNVLCEPWHISSLSQGLLWDTSIHDFHKLHGCASWQQSSQYHFHEAIDPSQFPQSSDMLFLWSAFSQDLVTYTPFKDSLRPL